MKIYKKLQQLAKKYLEKFKKDKIKEKAPEEDFKAEVDVRKDDISDSNSKIIDIKEVYRQ